MPPGWKSKQPDPDPGDVTDSDVDDDLNEWRMQMLVRAGFAEYDALQLLLSGADWHDCERLLRKGCQPDLILRILGN